MFNINTDEQRALIHFIIDADIEQHDIELIETRFNALADKIQRIPSLVIEVKKFSGWDDKDAFLKHFNFARQHQQLIPKIAVVTDSWFLSIMPKLANLFSGAHILRFPSRRLNAALQWAASDQDEAGEVQLIEGLPSDVLAFRVSGILSGKHYQQTIIPLVEGKLKKHELIKLLVVFDDDFQAYTGSAAWNDARLGLAHFSDFSRVAVVCDHKLIRYSVTMFGWMMPGEVAMFETEEFDDAVAWVQSS